MRKWIKEAWAWLKASNRLRHLTGGMVIGLGGDGWYCAMYAGTGVAAALELKDYLWGGKPDWIDLVLTVAGAAIGQCARQVVSLI